MKDNKFSNIDNIDKRESENKSAGAAASSKIPETSAEWVPDETVHNYALSLCVTCGEYMYSEKQMMEHRARGHRVYINYAAP